VGAKGFRNGIQHAKAVNNSSMSITWDWVGDWQKKNLKEDLKLNEPGTNLTILGGHQNLSATETVLIH